jgi:hypothetical protein
VRDVALAGDFKHKLSVGLCMGVPNLLDESDDVSPLEILRYRMTEYRFERATVRPCHRRKDSRLGAGASGGTD